MTVPHQSRAATAAENTLPKSLPRVLHVGTDRFALPLSPTDAKRFHGISDMSPNYMLAFSKDRRPRRFQQETRFYLLPDLPFQRVRQFLFLASCFVMTLYLSLFKGVRIAVSQSIYDALPLILARKVLRLTGRRICVVVQAHGDWEEASFLLGKLPRAVRPLVQMVSRFVLRNADVLRVISQFTLDKTRPYITEGTPCLSFPTFTDVDLFLEECPDCPSSPTPVCLYAGVLTPLKGVHILIEAVHLLRQRGVSIHLVIAGEGGYREPLELQVSNLGLAEQVSFVGFVDQSELRELMRQCDTLVLPSLSEGFGRVVIEAMACHKPVVVSSTGGLTGLVNHGETGLLVEPGAAAALAEAIKYLAEHPEKAREMGAKGRRFVQERYSNAAYFQSYRNMLEIASQTLEAWQ